MMWLKRGWWIASATSGGAPLLAWTKAPCFAKVATGSFVDLTALHRNLSNDKSLSISGPSRKMVSAPSKNRRRPQTLANVNRQLPLGLLNAAQGHPMLVELKNGETLNGHLVQCDTWMNLTLKEVVQTSPVRSSYLAQSPAPRRGGMC